MKKFLLKLIVIGTIIFGCLGGANANVISDSGHIYDTAMGGVIDNWYFNVGTSGDVDISTTYLSGSGFDSEFYLFIDDGDLTVDDQIGHDDDGGSGLESFLSSSLTAGDYLLRVSEYYFQISTSEWEDTVGGDWFYNLTITGADVSFNNAAPVPEPSTWLLLSSGLAGLTWFGRKRKKS